MDIVMTTLTIASLLAAAVCGVVAWRALHEERRRSAARVAALATAAGAPVGRIEAPVPVHVSSMFGTAPGAMLAGRPAIAVAVISVLAVTLLGIAATSGEDTSGETAVARTQGNAPLELISMRHARDRGTLTVTGLVRNPHAGTPVTRIAAVVFAFDRDGAFVASGRAPLDLTQLAPGDESPFVVSLPNITDVARYRVSFRTEAGVVRHVDRRAEEMARMPD